MATQESSVEKAATIQANATIAAAGASADATREASDNSSKATVTAAAAQAGASTSVATINAKNNIDVTKLDCANRIEVAKINKSALPDSDVYVQASATRYASDNSRAAQVETAHIDAANRIETTGLNNANQIALSDMDINGRLAVANINADAQVRTAATDSQARVTVAEIDQTGQIYSADRQLDGVKLREQGENNRLATKLNYADEKFNIALNLAQASLGQSGADAGPTPGLLDGSTVPYVSTRGVFTPGQVQLQVNAIYARNDARTNSQVRQAQGDLAGRGFSSNSPLLDALRVGLAGQNLRASAEGVAQVRLSAAQANADQVTKGQGLALQSWQARQQVALDDSKNKITRQVGLLGAVAQMVNVGG